MPTADDVARAVVSACRETGADPIALIEGQSGYSDYSLARARAYAAFALDDLFEIGPAKIKRMLHSRTDQSTLRFQKSKGVLRWWDDAALERVKAAIQAERKPASWRDKKLAALDLGDIRELPTDLVQELSAPARREYVRQTNTSPAAVRARQLVPIESRRVITRIQARPTSKCEDVTAELMGDPPRSRSALAERLPE